MTAKEIQSQLPLKPDGTKQHVYSNRQFSLRDYIALLSATERKYEYVEHTMPLHHRYLSR